MPTVGLIGSGAAGTRLSGRPPACDLIYGPARIVPVLARERNLWTIEKTMQLHSRGGETSFRDRKAATLELESTLTDRYQTTLPDAMRRARKLGKRDKIRHLVQPDGEVVLTRAASVSEDDPVLDRLPMSRKSATRRLAAIAALAFDVIPQDPTHPEYRQGSTRGLDRKRWFRSKFFQRYRRFSRFHRASRIIVYAWGNDADTKRAYERSDDAYRIVQQMLERGHPADDWRVLLAEAKRAASRLRATAGQSRRG